MLLECPAEKPIETGASLAWRLSERLVGMGQGWNNGPFSLQQRKAGQATGPKCFFVLPLAAEGAITLMVTVLGHNRLLSCPSSATTPGT